jgi:peptidoglycan/LPS O-acetylase OafA/YrhL
VLCAAIHADEFFSLSFALLIVGISSNRDWLSPLLAGRTMVYLGETSFALYMVHLFIWQIIEFFAMRAHMLRGSAVPGVILVAAVSVFFSSAAIYRYVEVPARDFIRGLDGQHFEASGPAARFSKGFGA